MSEMYEMSEKYEMSDKINKDDLIRRIKELREKKEAVIVAHNYQIDDVQDVADTVGDSLALSRYCAKSSARVIVFCGVHFMAESAKILSLEKMVLLPEKDAGCPMADMVSPEALIAFKSLYPRVPVVCYINSSAAVKAESDICCTSSNAVKVVRSIRHDEVIFVPDQNLGHYVAQKVPEKRIILWEGYCITHHRVRKEDVEKARAVHPDALLLVHPECKPEVVEMADFVGSTKQIIDFAASSNHQKMIIGTEMGILYKLKKDSPDKTFYLLSQGLVCPNMKKTRLESVYHALKEEQYVIDVEESVRMRAKKSLDRMHEVQENSK
ncbi:MAG: quinolinate synthase NadA [Clostridiales bacterium]|nr:quinolinate synthase NadA [Clostridiales bacterium]